MRKRLLRQRYAGERLVTALLASAMRVDRAMRREHPLAPAAAMSAMPPICQPCYRLFFTLSFS
jgi:hypothetical protein